MTALPQPTASIEQYLERERASQEKHELINGQVYAMSGASYRHNVITANLLGALREQLRGSPCRALASDLRIKVESTQTYTYADATVICGDPSFDDEQRDTLLNPTVIIEVLSPSTERYDRGAKFAHYRRLASLQVYLLISQNRPQVERFVRDGDDWRMTEFTDLASAVSLPPLQGTLALSEVYDGINFDEPAPDGEGDRAPRRQMP